MIYIKVEADRVQQKLIVFIALATSFHFPKSFSLKPPLSILAFDSAQQVQVDSTFPLDESVSLMFCSLTKVTVLLTALVVFFKSRF